MKCEIIRDLMPSYIDELTSEASNAALEEHVESCEECRKYMEIMRKELVSEEYLRKSEEEIKADIQPFQKLKKVTSRAIGMILFVCLLLMVVCSLVWYNLYGSIKTANSQDIAISYEKRNNLVQLTFSSQEDVYSIEVWDGWTDEEEEIPEDERWRNVAVMQYRELSFGHASTRYERGYGRLKFFFLDNNTVVTEEGDRVELSGDETLKLYFQDKVQEIKIADLYYSGSSLN